MIILLLKKYTKSNRILRIFITRTNYTPYFYKTFVPFIYRHIIHRISANNINENKIFLQNIMYLEKQKNITCPLHSMYKIQYTYYSLQTV